MLSAAAQLIFAHYKALPSYIPEVRFLCEHKIFPHEYTSDLYDFYGELLTEHQKQIYEDVVLGDLSFSEVAEDRGISRQGVHDLVRRCNKILNDYEAKLHLVEKFVVIREKVSQIHELVREKDTIDQEELLGRLEAISNEILEEL